MYKSIDLFAGIGGIRLGFDKAFKDDISTVFVSEWDLKARLARAPGAIGDNFSVVVLVGVRELQATLQPRIEVHGDRGVDPDHQLPLRLGRHVGTFGDRKPHPQGERPLPVRPSGPRLNVSDPRRGGQMPPHALEHRRDDNRVQSGEPRRLGVRRRHRRWIAVTPVPTLGAWQREPVPQQLLPKLSALLGILIG